MGDGFYGKGCKGADVAPPEVAGGNIHTHITCEGNLPAPLTAKTAAVIVGVPFDFGTAVRPRSDTIQRR